MSVVNECKGGRKTPVVGFDRWQVGRRPKLKKAREKKGKEKERKKNKNIKYKIKNIKEI